MNLYPRTVYKTSGYFLTKIIFLCIISFICISNLQNFNKVHAEATTTSTNSMLSLSPASGFTGVGDEFFLDIMLNTKGNNSLSTRVVLLFDPEYIELTKVEYTTLYCDYTKSTGGSEFGISKTVGYVVVTGICNDNPVKNNTPEVFATAHFKAKKVGDINVEFRYSGQDQPGYSVVYGSGSPPPNILQEKPPLGSYKIVQDADAYGGSTPGTGVVDSSLGVWFVVTLFIITGILATLYFYKRKE